MKKYIFTLTIIIVLFSLGHTKTPWEIYLSSPTPINAKNVVLMTYSSKERMTEKELYNEIELDLELLEIQIISSDKEAINLAFRLRQKADGYIRELFDIMLGKLIRINPILFLEAIHINNDIVDDIEHLVGNTGQAFVDRPKAELYEIEMRILALENVKVKKFEKIRDKCLAELYKHKKLLSDIPEEYNN